MFAYLYDVCVCPCADEGMYKQSSLYFDVPKKHAKINSHICIYICGKNGKLRERIVDIITSDLADFTFLVRICRVRNHSVERSIQGSVNTCVPLLMLSITPDHLGLRLRAKKSNFKSCVLDCACDSVNVYEWHPLWFSDIFCKSLQCYLFFSAYSLTLQLVVYGY